METSSAMDSTSVSTSVSIFLFHSSSNAIKKSSELCAPGEPSIATKSGAILAQDLGVEFKVLGSSTWADQVRRRQRRRSGDIAREARHVRPLRHLPCQWLAIEGGT